jgi:hypothetical protein
MANSFTFETFVSKYLYDAGFKAKADSDLRGTLESEGVEITAQVQAAIDQFQKLGPSTDLAKLAAAVDNSFVGLT